MIDPSFCYASNNKEEKQKDLHCKKEGGVFQKSCRFQDVSDKIII